MRHTTDQSLTPEQEQMRSVIDRSARIAALLTCGVLAVGGLYLFAIYLTTG